jgi:uncharacterized phage protein (TIGR02216 family)
MALGLGVLRWNPDTFWRATPAELSAALDGLAGRRAEPPGRGDLARLMAAFPDRTSTSGGHA